MSDYLHSSVLLIFLVSLGAAYGIGRLVRAYYERREARKPKPPMTRAERRRLMRGRK